MSRFAPALRLAAAAIVGLATQSALADVSFFRIPALTGNTFQSTSAQRLVAVNDGGAVVGGSNAASGPRAYYLAAGTTTPVDVGVASNSPAGAWANGYGINNANQVVGRVEVTNYSNYKSFVVTPGGSVSILDQSNVPTSTQSAAYDINNAGAIVGTTSFTYTNTSGQTATTGQGYVYLNNTMYLLGSLNGVNGSSNATAVNDSNVIVGSTNNAAGQSRAFKFAAASNGTGTMTEIATLGGTSASGFGINNAGDIVGWSNTAAGSRHAFLLSNGSSTPVDLNPTSIRSEAFDINSLGQAVGYDYFTDGVQRAALFANGTVLDLNAFYQANISGAVPTYTLQTAYGINDAGLIVGVGRDSSNGQTFNFAMSVPEPSSLAVMAIGAAAMLRRRKSV